MAPHAYLKAILLRAFGAALIILTDTYANALFLSSYSKDRIPYLFLALALVGFVSMQMLRSYMNRYFKQFVRWSHLIFISVFILFIFMLKLSYAWLPFVVAVFIMTAWAMASTMNTISVMSLFSLREFKTVSSGLNFVTTLTLVLLGLLIPVLLAYFSLMLLLYLIIAFFVALLIMNRWIDHPPDLTENLRHAPPPLKLSQNTLFISIFISSLFILLLYTFSEYAFKSELSRHYSSNEIAQFLAPFTAMTSLGVMLTQIFFASPLLRRWGVMGVILLSPLVFAFGALPLLIIPGLWAASLLFALGLICRRSFYSLGFQILVNVYAPAVRKLVQYQMDTLGRLVLGFSAMLLILLTWMGDLRILAFCIIVIAIMMGILARKLGAYYFQALKTAINLHRFDVDYLETEEVDETVTIKIALEAMAQGSEDAVFYGLTLLDKISLKELPPLVLDQLQTASVSLKKRLIRLVGRSSDPSASSILTQELMAEKNPELTWDLVNALFHFSSDGLLAYAMANKNTEIPAKKASVIHIFFKRGDANELKWAKDSLHRMLNHGDSLDQYWALKILNSEALEGGEDYITQLMNHSEEKVVASAIAAARFYPQEKIIDGLLEKFQNHALVRKLSASLIVMGAAVLPKLRSYADSLKNPRQLDSIIILFSKFPDPEAEEALLEFMLSRNLALSEASTISLAYRVKQFHLSEEGREKVYSHVLSEIEAITRLRGCADSSQDLDLIKEVHSRIFYAKKRYLYLLACLGDAKSILQIIPTLLTGDPLSRAYDSALEVLELCLPQRKLKDSIPHVLEAKSILKSASSQEPVFEDAWLTRVQTYKTVLKEGGARDPEMDLVFLLRNILFFSNLSAELLLDLVQIVQLRTASKGDILFKEGDRADGLYIIAEGTVEIIKDAELMNLRTTGQFFGELALLDDTPRSAAAVLRTETRFLFMSKQDFHRLSNELPEILRAVVRIMLAYLRQSENQEISLA